MRFYFKEQHFQAVTALQDDLRTRSICLPMNHRKKKRKPGIMQQSVPAHAVIKEVSEFQLFSHVFPAAKRAHNYTDDPNHSKRERKRQSIEQTLNPERENKRGVNAGCRGLSTDS